MLVHSFCLERVTVGKCFYVGKLFLFGKSDGWKMPLCWHTLFVSFCLESWFATAHIKQTICPFLMTFWIYFVCVWASIFAELLLVHSHHEMENPCYTLEENVQQLLAYQDLPGCLCFTFILVHFSSEDDDLFL